MSERPNPLKEAASKVGAVWAGVSGLVSIAVVFGVLTVAQGQAISTAGSLAPDILVALGTALSGLLTIGGGLVAAFRTASAAREHVTPVADPRNDLGERLVPVRSSGDRL